MARTYVKKTSQRRREDRKLSARAEYRDTPDLDKLTELLIRFALQETGERRATRASEPRSLTDAPAPS